MNNLLDVNKEENKEVQIRTYDIETGKSKPLIKTNKKVKKFISSKKNIKNQPLDFRSLSELLQEDATHSGAIELKKNMILGRGWKLLQDKYMSKVKKIEKLMENPTGDPFITFYELLERFISDYETLGNAYISIKKINKKVKIKHVSGNNIYIKTNNNNDITGFVQLNNYGGVEQEFNTYNPDKKLENGKLYLVRLINYTPSNGYYGLPQYISAIPAIVENMYIREFGINFFDNAATPSLAIVVTGADWGNAQETAVENFLENKSKGVDNAHKILVLQVDSKDAKIEVEEVSKGFEGSFLEQNDKNRDEIARAHGNIPPKLLGIVGGSSIGGGGESIGELKTFIETCINGKQRKICNFLDSLFYVIYDIKPKFKFEDIDIISQKDWSVIYNLLSQIIDTEGNAVMNVEEIREKMNMKKSPKGVKMPMKSSMIRDYENIDENTNENINSDGDIRLGENIDEESSTHEIQNLELDKNEK